MCDQYNGRGALPDYAVKARDPISATGRLPIVLHHTFEQRICALPVALPVFRTRIAKARENENGKHRVHG